MNVSSWPSAGIGFCPCPALPIIVFAPSAVRKFCESNRPLALAEYAQTAMKSIAHHPNAVGVANAGSPTVEHQCAPSQGFGAGRGPICAYPHHEARGLPQTPATHSPGTHAACLALRHPRRLVPGFTTRRRVTALPLHDLHRV